MNFSKQLQSCRTITDVFELVKTVVQKELGTDQAGLMVGLADLGAYPQGYVGAFYAPDANTIVLNRKIVEKVKCENPDLFLPYVFHVLLHEYLHSIGVFDEDQTRSLTKSICGNLGHSQVEQFANGSLFPKILHAEPPQDIQIEYISGIDRKNTGYIA